MEQVYGNLQWQTYVLHYLLNETNFIFPKGLRDCCRSMRIGKILIDSDHDTHEAKVVYAKFPEDIAQRKVLLMYPIMSKYLFLSCCFLSV
jgi:uracil phosphoribosyltransferase